MAGGGVADKVFVLVEVYVSAVVVGLARVGAALAFDRVLAGLALAVAVVGADAAAHQGTVAGGLAGLVVGGEDDAAADGDDYEDGHQKEKWTTCAGTKVE